MSEKKRLAIITTHPVQYNAPLFKLIAERNNIGVKVFYTWGSGVLQNKFDPGFGRVIEWDIPLLEGYEYEFVENKATRKGSDHFKGIINPGLNKAIEQFNADAVLVYGWPFVSHLKAMRYFKRKIPVLFRGDSTLLDEQSGFKPMLRSLLLRWVYRHIDYALYTGKSNYDYFIKAGLTPKQLVFAPHAVENDRFAKKIITHPGLREQLAIGKTDFVFLFAGKLEEKKAVELLIKAFSDATFDETIHLLITGNGPLEADVKAASANISNIHFLNFRNQQEMPALYQACDVFVLPSKGPGETWGLVVNEAMAAGRPVIVSNKCGCAADLVIAGKTGFVFESGHVQDLCDHLKWCASNRITVNQMGVLAADKIRDYSFTKVAQAIEEVVYR